MKVSQDEFDRLPALIPLATFMRFSGLPKKTVESMRQDGSLRAWRPPGRRKARYLKSELARICGYRES